MSSNEPVKNGFEVVYEMFHIPLHIVIIVIQVGDNGVSNLPNDLLALLFLEPNL